MTTDAETLIQDITNILIENGCGTPRLVILELAIYILERDKKVLQSL